MEGNLFNQKQYSLLYKNMSGRNLRVRIDLLNDKDVKVDSFEGITTDGSIDFSGDSTYRRVSKLSTLLEKNLLPSPSSKIWFNKRVQIHIGLLDWDDSIIWYNMGKFAIDEVDAKNSQDDKSLDLNLLDYMAYLDGTLSGYLSHEVQFGVSSGAKVSDIIRASVKDLSKAMIDNLQIDGLDATVPYDMEFNPNGTVYDIVKELTELYMSQEFFFDVNGVFRVQEIKERKQDAVIWDFTEDNMDLTIDYANSIKLSNVKNSVYVWGHTDDKTGSQISYVYRNRWSRSNFSELSSITDKQKGDICSIKSEDKSYLWNGSSWDLLDFNVVAEFNIENIGEKIWTFSDDKITTESQAKLRVKYELIETSNFAETISFSCVPIYVLDVNKKIKISDKDSGIEGDYLITGLSHSLNIDGATSVQARKIYY